MDNTVERKEERSQYNRWRVLGHGNVWIEAVVVGILMVLMGLVVSWLLHNHTKLPVYKGNEACADWNKNHIFEWTLFLTGFLVHLFCSAFGLSRYYCGVADKNMNEKPF